MTASRSERDWSGSRRLDRSLRCSLVRGDSCDSSSACGSVFDAGSISSGLLAVSTFLGTVTATSPLLPSSRKLSSCRFSLLDLLEDVRGEDLGGSRAEALERGVPGVSPRLRVDGEAGSSSVRLLEADCLRLRDERGVPGPRGEPGPSSRLSRGLGLMIGIEDDAEDEGDFMPLALRVLCFILEGLMRFSFAMMVGADEDTDREDGRAIFPQAIPLKPVLVSAAATELVVLMQLRYSEPDPLLNSSSSQLFSLLPTPAVPLAWCPVPRPRVRCRQHFMVKKRHAFPNTAYARTLVGGVNSIHYGTRFNPMGRWRNLASLQIKMRSNR